MKFELPPEKQRFLKLAIGSVPGSLSGGEQAELTRLTQAQPALKKELREIRSALQEDQDEDFLELLLRVLFDTASLEDLEEIRGLKSKNPRQWEQFHQMQFILQTIGQSSKQPIVESNTPEPMPEHVRSRLLGELKEQRRKRDEGPRT